MPIALLLALCVLLLANGCATQEKKVSPAAPIAAAESYLNESRRKQLSKDTRIGLLLAAAHTSRNEVTRGEAPDRARQIYNTSAAELTVLLSTVPSKWNVISTINGPDALYRVSFAQRQQRRQARGHPPDDRSPAFRRVW
jgi:hypothetical protein